MITAIGDRSRRLLVCLTVLSVTGALTGGVVWAADDAAGAAPSEPSIENAQKQCACDSGAARLAGAGEAKALEPGSNAARVAFGTAQTADFGRIAVGSNATREVPILNIGPDPVSVTDATIEGDDAGAFTVTDDSVSPIEPGETEHVTVVFSPDRDGTHRATLRLEQATGPLATADLIGTGVTPDIEVDREQLRFANVTDQTVAETFTLTNDGTTPLTVDALRIVGPDRAAFEPAASSPFTIEPGQSREVPVRFTQSEPAARFATMHILSDDPEQPQRNLWLTNTPTVARVSPSHIKTDRTHVNASVVDAAPNTTQSLNISWPATRDDTVAIDALSYTPERGGEFSINVTKRDAQFEGAPAFEPADGTEEVAFVSMDSTIANEDLQDVTVTFRVRQDQLAGDEAPDDVALYTHRNGQWVELPTTLVDESRTHYFFETESPGLLDFATGIKQANFRIDDAAVSVTEISAGESVDVVVRVTNVGGADGTYTVRLIRDDTVVDQRELSIAATGSRQTILTESFDNPGTYELYVNDHLVGTITVHGSADSLTDLAFTARSPA